jgi:hypothetical protein
MALLKKISKNLLNGRSRHDSQSCSNCRVVALLFDFRMGATALITRDNWWLTNSPQPRAHPAACRCFWLVQKVLLGLNLGESWDRRGYQLYEPTADGSFNFRGNGTDHLQRAVSFASLTALSQNKKLPFFLQTRYGHSFTGFFDEAKSFWQVIAGLHWGIL